MTTMLVQFVFALLPLYLVRFTVFGVPANVLEAGIAALFPAVLASAIRGKRLGKLFALPQEKTFRIGAALLAAGVLTSLAFSPTLRGLGIVKSWFVIPFLFFLLTQFVFREGGAAKKLFGAYAVSAMGVSLIALAYAARGSYTFDGRLTAFFESPNHLAMYIAPALLIVVSRILYLASCIKTGTLIGYKIQSTKYRLQKAIVGYTCSFTLLSIALFLTRSHGAWLGVAGAFGISQLLQKNSAKTRSILIAAAIAGGMLLPLLTVRYWPFWQDASRIPERSSVASRVIIWRSALVIGSDNPVFGIGPGSFQEKYLAYQKNYPPYLEWAVPQPHNVFLAFWLQTGLLGLAGFLLLLVWFFRKVFGLYPLPPTLYPIPLALMLYILLHGSVDTTYWKNDLSVFFWVLLALM